MTARPPHAKTPKLELIDVHKSYGRTPVLRGMTMDVAEHDVVCLIGPSGCGKSTLLRCVDLLDPIASGQILLDGADITARGVSADDVRRRVGIVFQSFNLFPHLTVLDNVTLAARRVHHVSKRDAEAKANELLERFGLAGLARSYPNRISGGQNQRAAIVRALMGQPELLLLDEVTSALDPELVGEVLGLIGELADGGMTMVLATHEMGFAREVADKVCFLSDGRVLESGPPSQLFEDPQQPRTQQFLRLVHQAGRI
ncbi:MAG: amino acid ABC transporter ATP-binding protein [Actinobacteria bacterium]|nr:amino acid ABC transporter ATP-binding protein [Actinomycetota bacterium]MCB9390130.1 amino acid ABC transporter ATP-binding protein [Acidimicrobiia bacterium]